MTQHVMYRSRRTASVIAITSALGMSTPALAQIDEIIVSAQKKEEALQSVPIAVTAFDASSLDRQQIDTFSDLQYSAPNVSYTKTNFSASNLQIRGIGSTLTAASSDSGVGVHINDVFVQSPRLFETEYYDLERVELLRGPQGTLYGRNATAGTINMMTKRPELEEFGITGDVQYGNFDHFRVKGSVNLPMGDTAAARIAGLFLNREGYTENVNADADFDSIDGRDLWSMRGSFLLQPSDSTSINIMVSYFEEDDNRTRATKQLCDNDPSAILGCEPTGLSFETANPDSTLAGILASDLVLGAFGLTPYGFGGQVDNPADLRKTNLDFEPVYQADETFAMIQIDQDLGDSFTLTGVLSMQDTWVFSNQDYNNVSTPALAVPDAVAFALPTTYATYFADDCLPVSEVSDTYAGVLNGEIRECAPGIQAYDQSSSKAEQWSGELRLASDFDGPLNFLVAGYYLDYENDADYYVISNTLDYFSLVGAATDSVGLATPYFNSETDFFGLESTAIFGEVYYDMSDSLSITAGLRWTQDEKSIRDRQPPLLSGGAVVLDGTTVVEQVAAIMAANDADAGTTGSQPYRVDNVSFEEFTGRLVVDWSPNLGFTDDTLIYASYSRGYKGGGFNPPFDPTLFPTTALTFEPELLNAYEIGTKNSMTVNGAAIQANITGFYYDYEGLQVSKIVNRTSFNENIDATIWGLEGEFLFAPTEPLLFNMNLAYLNTEIGEGVTSIDTRDPTNGGTDITLLKDTQGANCTIEHNTSGDPLADVGLLTFLNGLSAPMFSAPTTPDGINTTSVGFTVAPCGTLTDLVALYNGGALTDWAVTSGREADISGNELQNSPEVTVNVGAQYTHMFGAGSLLTTRVDYYWQDDMWARIFNREATDRIDSYGLWNAQVTYAEAEGRWYVRGFIQNIADEDAITGHYVTDPSSGLFTNIFMTEPRLYGLNIGVNF